MVISKSSRAGLLSLSVMGIRVVTLLVKFLFTVFIARFMGFEEVGVYGLVAGCGVVLPAVLGLGLNYSLIRAAVVEPLESIVNSLTCYLYWLALVYSAIFLIGIGWGAWTGNVLIAALVISILFMEHLHSDFYHLLLNRSKAISSNVLLFIRSALWMLIYMGICLYERKFLNIFWLFFAWLVGTSISLLWFLFIVREWPWGAAIRIFQLPKRLALEVPLSKIPYLNSVATTVSFYSDRYLITYFLGLELAGIYIFFWTIYSAIFNLVYTGVVQFFRPVLVVAAKEKLTSYIDTYKSCLVKTFFVSSAVVMVSGLVVYHIVPLLDKPLAMEWLPILWIILIGTVFSLLREAQMLLFYSNHEDVIILKATLIMFAFSLILNVSLIPALGLWGAAISFLLVNIVMIIMQINFSKTVLEKYRV